MQHIILSRLIKHTPPLSNNTPSGESLDMKVVVSKERMEFTIPWTRLRLWSRKSSLNLSSSNCF